MDWIKNEILKGREILKKDWDLTEKVESDLSKGIKRPPFEKPFEQGSFLIELPARENLKLFDISLWEAIFNRRSKRKYTEDFLNIDELAFLLLATNGVKKITPNVVFKTVPSGGAMHPIETYLIINRVKDLERKDITKGLYRYLPIEHKLLLEKSYYEGMIEDFDDALNNQFWDAAAYFVWTAIPYRMEYKYTVVSHKMIAIEAGHICQNLYLAVQAIGCGTCGIAAYSQKKMDKFLGIDGNDEFTIYCAPIGKVNQ